jgi:two-component system CheB/CheR fusion protein
MSSTSKTSDLFQLNESFNVVGISASPVKLGALEQFFSQMISTSGLAFIVVQHGLAANKYFPADVLAKYTPLEVYIAEDDMQIQPNCIYLATPDQEIIIRAGRIIITDLNAISSQSLPADRFMTMLADAFGSKTICILLSVEDGDGIRGIEAINKVNGMVMVEMMKSALSHDMMRSEITIDQIEYVLSPQEMPWHLLEYIKFYANHTKESIEEERATLFAILKQATGVDFSFYKQASIMRRIQRRMGIQGFTSLHGYNRLLYENSDEVTALQKDLLIGVTHFFRDPDAFAILCEKVIPVIFQQRSEEK